MVEKWTNEPCSGVDEVVNNFWVLTVGRRSISQKQAFWLISAWKLSNSSKIQRCTRSQGLPLNNLSKELVDQDYLIDYVGCDESLKCAGCPTLRYPFCFDLQVLTGTTSNGLINPSSHPIHKLFGMEVELLFWKALGEDVWRNLPLWKNNNALNWIRNINSCTVKTGPM